MIQWLRLCASTVESMGSIPGQGTKILAPHTQNPKPKHTNPHALPLKKKKKQRPNWILKRTEIFFFFFDRATLNDFG